jgi:hypothetical protein
MTIAATGFPAAHRIAHRHTIRTNRSTTSVSVIDRRTYRQARARPILDHLHAWLSEVLATFSRKSDTSKAILYALNRWEAITRYCDDKRLEVGNLPVERALRGVAIGRRNYLFAGADSGGDVQP